MNTRSKTDEKEGRRQRGWRRQGVCRESRPYFSFEFRFRIMFSCFFPFQFEIKQCAILLPWKLFLSNESRSFCTRLFLFRFINRNRNTAQKEYALNFGAAGCMSFFNTFESPRRSPLHLREKVVSFPPILTSSEHKIGATTKNGENSPKGVLLEILRRFRSQDAADFGANFGLSEPH